ncbi:MAG TPA: hypothetical protein VD970_09615 [Acetobacteraceae bacterium]|nr:hypothetical protein [Acetobacteraceae bacterium]
MISAEALSVLERSTCRETLVFLPPSPRLDRKLYQEVNEVLSRLGGKWKGEKVQAHVFDEDPAPLLATVVDTGEMPPKNPLAFFATPAPMVDRMLQIIGGALAHTRLALEPSAGEGAILRRLVSFNHLERAVDAVEIDPKRCARLRAAGFAVTEADFLAFQPVPPGARYGAVVMNPPFTAPGDPLAYIAHIRHAHSLLAPGGELVSVAPNGFTTRTDRRCSAFREFVEEHGSWEPCEPGAFKESGTGVACVLVHLRA